MVVFWSLRPSFESPYRAAWSRDQFDLVGGGCFGCSRHAATSSTRSLTHRSLVLGCRGNRPPALPWRGTQFGHWQPKAVHVPWSPGTAQGWDTGERATRTSTALWLSALTLTEDCGHSLPPPLTSLTPLTPQPTRPAPIGGPQRHQANQPSHAPWPLATATATLAVVCAHSRAPFASKCVGGPVGPALGGKRIEGVPCGFALYDATTSRVLA